MISNKHKFIFSSVMIVLLVACSTKKNTWLSRNYHNLTAHYNGYYNAKVKLKDGADKLADSHEDKYDRILSVFKYADATKAKAVFPQMDDAIKRTSIVIDRHSMQIKGKEYCNWIDDNWLVLGKAQFYKHDNYAAIETFQYIISNYPNGNCKWEALLWLTKTYLEQSKVMEAEEAIDRMRNAADFPSKLRGELAATAADFYLQMHRWEQGAEQLSKAIIFAKDRDYKIRWMFILAQVNQLQLGDYKKAYQLYTDVIKKNPVYVMAFNAKINRARCYDASSSNSAEVKKELLKMVKDVKNAEFLDQIYYALAGIAQKEKDEPAAIDYLHKSVKASTSNVNQKALSYLELAKIYFAHPDYKTSQSYYDSTITFLTNDHPDYDNILIRRNSLTKLIKNLNIIALEDSLQKLSLMPKEKLEAYIDELIAKEQKEAQKQKEEKKEEEAEEIFKNDNQQEQNKFNQNSGSNWYFYNTSAISFGFSEFLKKWGNRKNEDNWRRSSKNISGNEDFKEDTSAGKLETIENDTAGKALSRQKFLASIPKDKEAIEKSNVKIIDAYYVVGLIYKEQLNDPKAAARTFETLLQKFPKCKYELQCYYQLYRIYAQLHEQEKSDHYKNIILNEYPNSVYATLILHPEAAADLVNQKSKLVLYYEDTYKRFRNKQYAEVIKRKTESDTLFPANDLMPKFDFLRTLSIGYMQPVPVFETSLKEIVKNYPTDSVKYKAQEILDYLNKQKPVVAEGVKKDSAAVVKQDEKTDKKKTEMFTYNSDTVQWVVISFATGAVSSEVLTKRISDFNTKFYSNETYNVSAIIMDAMVQMVVIKSFDDKDQAMDYSSTLADDEDVFNKISMQSTNQFVITPDNFSLLLKNKNLHDFLEFFHANYEN